MKNYIKELLKSKNIKQKELANILGISSAAISQWTTPESVGIENVYKMCKLFSISVDEFFSRKLTNETTEEKCARLYNIDGYDFDEIIKNRDKEALVDFTIKLANINESVYNLLYLKMANKISAEGTKELEYIDKYISYNVYNSMCFEKDKYYSFYNLDRDLEIAKQIEKKIKIGDKNNFIWELKKIYNIKNKINWDTAINNEMVNDNILGNVLRSYTEIERDRIFEKISFMSSARVCDFMLSHGANCLYREDFCEIIVNSDDLNKFEGEIIPVDKYNKIDSILLKKRVGNVNLLSYDEYQEIINKEKEEEIKWLKVKENDPIKYWEYIKNKQY